MAPLLSPRFFEKSWTPDSQILPSLIRHHPVLVAASIAKIFITLTPPPFLILNKAAAGCALN
jgi:hypothetical protein